VEHLPSVPNTMRVFFGKLDAFLVTYFNILHYQYEKIAMKVVCVVAARGNAEMMNLLNRGYNLVVSLGFTCSPSISNSSF